MGTFGPHFKMARMTWIKPSFLWMMYRCGWATKEGQERVLAIDIKRTAFDYIIKNAVLSTFHPETGGTMEEGEQVMQSSDIRCQWDPERDIWGNPLRSWVQKWSLLRNKRRCWPRLRGCSCGVQEAGRVYIKVSQEKVK